MTDTSDRARGEESPQGRSVHVDRPVAGPPTIERDRCPARSPRGRKAWALLCYLLLTCDSAEAGSLLDVGGELLEGLSVPSSAAFESWLLVARYRAAAVLEARLREAAVALLAGGHAGEAIQYASRAVACSPLEEGNHELLVRGLAMSGNRAAALRQVAVCEDLLRRECGVEASAALREAATAGAGSPRVPPLGGRAAASSQLEAGNAAIVAGAVDAGLQCLRRAVDEAARCGDTALHGRALVALGSALVHAVRGRDEEGSVVLHEAIRLASQAGDRATAVKAHRKLGFVEVQAGRHQTADTWLTKAQALAETDEEIAAILGLRGLSASDRGDYPAAFEHLGESIERTRRCAHDRQQAWSLSVLARAPAPRRAEPSLHRAGTLDGADPRTALDGLPVLAAGPPGRARPADR